MGTAKAEIDIDAPADAVWSVVGPFGGLGDWMPGIESCRVEGDDRIIQSAGMTITEHLIAQDDSARTITYAVVDGAPMESHQATITVTPKEDGSHVTWDVEATPDDMATMMGTIYQQSLEAAKHQIEG